jgi:hypothetical protein
MRIGCAEKAFVEKTTTATGIPATAVSFRGVTVVLVLERYTQEVVPLTAYVAGRNPDEAIGHVVRNVASMVHEIVDPADRIRGWA